MLKPSTEFLQSVRNMENPYDAIALAQWIIDGGYVPEFARAGAIRAHSHKDYWGDPGNAIERIEAFCTAQYYMYEFPVLSSWVNWHHHIRESKVDFSPEIAAEYFFLSIRVYDILRRIRRIVANSYHTSIPSGQGTAEVYLDLGHNILEQYGANFLTLGGIQNLLPVVEELEPLVAEVLPMSSQNSFPPLIQIGTIIKEMGKDSPLPFTRIHVKGREQQITPQEVITFCNQHSARLHLVSAYSSGMLIAPLSQFFGLNASVKMGVLSNSQRRDGETPEQQDHRSRWATGLEYGNTNNDQRLLIFIVDEATGVMKDDGRTLRVLNKLARDTYPNALFIEDLHRWQDQPK